MTRPLRSVAGALHAHPQLVAADARRGQLDDEVDAARLVDERLLDGVLGGVAVVGAFGGVNDISHPLSPMTTSPMTASVPNARRSRSAVGGVRSGARSRRCWATWRAVRPTNSMIATNTVLISSTRPCDSLNSEPPSRRYSWTRPLTTVSDDRRCRRCGRTRGRPARGPPRPDRPARRGPAAPRRRTRPPSRGRGRCRRRTPSDGEVAAGAGEPDRDHGERRDGERRQLRRRVDDPLGAQHDPARRDHEHEAGDRGAAGPAGVEQVEPRAGAEARCRATRRSPPR